MDELHLHFFPNTTISYTSQLLRHPYFPISLKWDSENGERFDCPPPFQSIAKWIHKASSKQRVDIYRLVRSLLLRLVYALGILFARVLRVQQIQKMRRSMAFVQWSFVSWCSHRCLLKRCCKGTYNWSSQSSSGRGAASGIWSQKPILSM